MDHVTNATVRLRAGSPSQLSQLIQRSRLRLFGHVARMDASLDISRALKTSVRGLPVEWKRPPGRPRHTWLRILGADLQALNHGLNSAWRCAQDREHWKLCSSSGHALDDDDDDSFCMSQPDSITDCCRTFKVQQ